MYEGIPHLFTPIITEPKLAANALRNAVREMERRLKLLAERGVRNIDQYNKLFDEDGTPSLFEDRKNRAAALHRHHHRRTRRPDDAGCSPTWKKSITRLAQMARAVGIHLVLATQRPSVDVITGLIKANFPARDIFPRGDQGGLAHNSGRERRGERCWAAATCCSCRRARRGCSVCTRRLSRKKRSPPWWSSGRTQGDSRIRERLPRVAEGRQGPRSWMRRATATSNDELFEDAVRLVLEFGKASTSLLQRRLRIGYGRAAHLIDMMERDGIVGPADGSKPREILKPPDWLNQIDPVMR